MAFLNQRALAENVGLTLATVSNFLTGKPVDYGTFVDLCARLHLNCEEIAELEVETQLPLEEAGVEEESTSRHQDWGEAIGATTSRKPTSLCSRLEKLY